MTENAGKNETEPTADETEPIQRSLHYFAADGSYGDAVGLVVMETTMWTADDWDIIDQASDLHRVHVARLLTESYEPDRDDEFIKNQLVELYGIDLSPYGG